MKKYKISGEYTIYVPTTTGITSIQKELSGSLTLKKSRHKNEYAITGYIQMNGNQVYDLKGRTKVSNLHDNKIFHNIHGEIKKKDDTPVYLFSGSKELIIKSDTKTSLIDDIAGTYNGQLFSESSRYEKTASESSTQDNKPQAIGNIQMTLEEIVST